MLSQLRIRVIRAFFYVPSLSTFTSIYHIFDIIIIWYAFNCPIVASPFLRLIVAIPCAIHETHSGAIFYWPS